MTWSVFTSSGALKTAAASVGYGTTLPASPVDGQEYIFVDSTTSPTYQWRFRYNTGSSNTDKWEFIGGIPARAFVVTTETTTSLTAADLATVGPSFTVPRAGIYSVVASAIMNNSASGSTWLRVVNGAGTTTILTAGTQAQVRGTIFADGTLQDTTTARAASDIIRMKYYVDGNTATVENRSLYVTPVRVS